MKKSIRMAVTAALTLGAVSLGGQVFAADADQPADEHALGETVVTATRTPLSVRQAPANVAVITAQEIEQNHYQSISEALEHINGVVVDRASGEEYIRLNGDDRVVVMVDGVRLNNDQGVVNGRAGVDLRMIPSVKNIKRIEVVKGAGSALYGSDAIGGVVNVITKEAAKKAGMQVNLEGRRTKGDGDLFPYANFFLRADSGQVGKLRVSAYGGRRDIMPIYSQRSFDIDKGVTIRNSLRYYGDIKNIGLTAAYDIAKDHSLSFSLDRVSEEMKRHVKRSNSFIEPVQNFKRELDRDNYRLSYTGRGGASDWKVDLDYTKMNEDDITVISYYSNSRYEGKNWLNYIDDLMHKQWSIKASANTQVNNAHLLSYGIGFTQEKGAGSRLKNAPNTYTRTIDPWDYDKNLYTRGGTGTPMSNVHNYAMTRNAAGIPKYDNAYEWYGYKDANGNSVAPAFTYQDYLKYNNMGTLPPDVAARREAFANEIKADPRNNHLESFYSPWLTMRLYYDEDMRKYQQKVLGHGTVWHGKEFMKEFTARQNQQTIGTAEIKKQYVFLQDT